MVNERDIRGMNERERCPFKFSLVLQYSSILDATRISDGRIVFLKVITTSVHPYETDIGLFFSTEPIEQIVPIYM